MTALVTKKKFLKYFVSKYPVSVRLQHFLRALYDDKETLNKVIFSKNALESYNFTISINISRRTTIISINGKHKADTKILRHILRALRESPTMKLNICITHNKTAFYSQYDNVCYDMELVKQTIYDVAIDSILNSARKVILKDKIDEALDNNNEDEFIKLTSEYNSL